MADVPEPTAVAAAVERRIVSVLFADLVGFTSLSERLDAEDVATIQDAYFGTTRETIERYGGSVEKFIGDAAMAVFGAPRARDDDAERAVRAGLALIGAVEQLGARLGLEPGALQLRVGVNSGEVVHATAGLDAGRVTGDTVNTAARLQTASTPNRVLVGELTALAVGDAIDLAEPVQLELKGKGEPVRARLVVGLRPEPSRDAALGELRAPILGREAQLGTLMGMAAGRVTIIAPPGVGKSRLVAELAERAAGRGDRILRARVRPQAANPYEAIAELLRAAGAEVRLASALGDMPPVRRDAIAAEVESLLHPAAMGGTSGAADLSAERDARFGAWREALDALAGGDRTMWIVEDVHWAGGDLLAFLDQAASDRRLIVCTARPSILDSDPAWVEAGTRLELETLPAADAAGLITALIGDVLPQELVLAATERSDGNPLFIEELLRTWASVGVLVRDDDAWRLTVEPERVALPATVQAIYAAQLDDLPPDARLVARRASVAGRRFADAAFGPLELDDKRVGLETLRRRAFVAGPQADPAGDVYAYRHALLRDAGYASLARAERARLHAALARWLEETAGERSGEVAQLIAEHYAAAAEAVPALASDGPDRESLAIAAAAWFERAAATALGLAAPAAAARLLERSLEHTPPGDVVATARRRLRRGEILADSAALDLAIDEMTAARDALEPGLPADADLYAEAAYHLGLAFMQQIRFPEAEALSADAAARLEKTDAHAGRIRLIALHAWAVAAQGRDEGAGQEASLALEQATALGDPLLEVDILEHYAATTDELGTGSIETWERLSRVATAAGRWRQATIADRVRGMLLTDSDPTSALALFNASAELASAHGLTEQLGWADLARCETLFVIGRWDDALEAGARAITLAERYVYERLGFRTWMILLPMLAARGDGSWNDRYEAWWATAAAHFPSAVTSPYGLVLRAATPIWLARASGRSPAPPDLDLAAVPPYSNPHFAAAREILAEAFIDSGDVERAAAMAADEPEPDWTALMLCSQALIGAWVATARGDAAEVQRLANVAAEHAREASAAWWLARALALEGAAEEATEISARLRLA